MNENNQETMEILPSNNGVFSDPSNDNRTGSDGIPNGFNTDNLVTDTDGTPISPNVWTDGYSHDADSVSGGDIATDTPSYTETLLEMQEANAEADNQVIENLTRINSILVLIFAFLLLEWTEKKIKVVVNRFTDKRRH